MGKVSDRSQPFKAQPYLKQLTFFRCSKLILNFNILINSVSSEFFLIVLLCKETYLVKFTTETRKAGGESNQILKFRKGILTI